MDPQQIIEDSHIDAIIESVDQALEELQNKNVGIKFEVKIYKALVDRELIKEEKYGVLGTGLLASTLPAYKGKWPAHITHETDGWGFTVGISE
ncbi:MAG: hypothetical protein KAT26_06525 [Marinosulfonomonas sp.]|nr:hypothetical protein [Marinosulfonomonas sp.]